MPTPEQMQKLQDLIGSGSMFGANQDMSPLEWEIKRKELLGDQYTPHLGAVAEETPQEQPQANPELASVGQQAKLEALKKLLQGNRGY